MRTVRKRKGINANEEYSLCVRLYSLYFLFQKIGICSKIGNMNEKCGGQKSMVNEVEFKKANNYSLKCMRVTFIVMVIAWILNVLHVFIVDQTIMNHSLIGVVIFVVLGHGVKYVIGFE